MPEAVALPDRVDVRAGVLAEHASLRVDDRPGRAAETAVALEEVRRGGCRRGSTGPASRGLRATASPAARGQLAHLRACCSPPSGKRSRASELGRERGEHVALVLALVGGAVAQQRRRLASSTRA